MAEKQIFEYWSHAAAYLPMRDYRYSLLRKQAIASGIEKHWHIKDESLMNSVLKRIQMEGPLMAKDFEDDALKKTEWNSKPAKQALNYLFMQGELMISSRVNFHKVYDLAERVLPERINTSLPSYEEYARYLIHRYLKANALGQAAEMAYLLKNTKPLISKTLQEMQGSGELIQIQLGNDPYYALEESLELLNQPLNLKKLKILSPFDNLLIQRRRMQKLFDFDYQIECYVPAAKRLYGYFSLPILWDGKLVARMDCKADRKQKILHIHHLALEAGLIKTEAFAAALAKELQPFLTFNKCKNMILHKSSPSSFKPLLLAAIGFL